MTALYVLAACAGLYLTVAALSGMLKRWKQTGSLADRLADPTPTAAEIERRAGKP